MSIIEKPEFIGAIGSASKRIAFGVLMILTAVFLMALQDAIIKLASSNVTLWQLYVLRALIALPLLIAPAFYNNETAIAWPRVFVRWNMTRAGLLVIMYIAIYAAIPVLPLAVIAAGMYSAPLFIALLSAAFINEPVERWGWFALVLGAAGVVLILRPGTDVFSPYSLLPVLAGFLYALAAILTRSKCQEERPINLAMALNIALLVTGIIGSLFILVWKPASDKIALSPFLFSEWADLLLTDWMLIGALAILTVGIGITLATAYQSAPPAIIATFDYAYLIFATAFGFLLFSEIPDWLTIVGMLIVFGAGVLAAAIPTQKQQ